VKKLKRILGYVLVSLPFIGMISIFCIATSMVWLFCVLFGAVVVNVILGLGFYLIDENK